MSTTLVQGMVASSAAATEGATALGTNLLTNGVATGTTALVQEGNDVGPNAPLAHLNDIGMTGGPDMLLQAVLLAVASKGTGKGLMIAARKHGKTLPLVCLTRDLMRSTEVKKAAANPANATDADMDLLVSSMLDYKSAHAHREHGLYNKAKSGIQEVATASPENFARMTECLHQAMVSKQHRAWNIPGLLGDIGVASEEYSLLAEEALVQAAKEVDGVTYERTIRTLAMLSAHRQSTQDLVGRLETGTERERCIAIQVLAVILDTNDFTRIYMGQRTLSQPPSEQREWAVNRLVAFTADEAVGGKAIRLLAELTEGRERPRSLEYHKAEIARLDRLELYSSRLKPFDKAYLAYLENVAMSTNDEGIRGVAISQIVMSMRTPDYSSLDATSTAFTLSFNDVNAQQIKTLATIFDAYPGSFKWSYSLINYTFEQFLAVGETDPDGDLTDAVRTGFYEAMIAQSRYPTLSWQFADLENARLAEKEDVVIMRTTQGDLS